MTKYCDFRIVDNIAKCSMCGFSMPATSQRILRHCDSVSLLEKARNFTSAAIRHAAAGLPMASDEEIARRHAICVGCEFYDGKACVKCGCPVKREKAYLSKLSWADQACPVGQWGPVDNRATTE